MTPFISVKILKKYLCYLISCCAVWGMMSLSLSSLHAETEKPDRTEKTVGTEKLKKEEALSILNIINPGMRVRKFCIPCGDTIWTHVIVEQVGMEEKNGSYDILLNRRVINLNHHYLYLHDNWVNMSAVIGRPVRDAPEFLPEHARIP